MNQEHVAGPTAQVAAFVTECDYASLPAAVVREAKRSILNWLGVAIGAANEEPVDIVLRLAREMGCAEQVTVFGRRDRVDALHGALINGMSSHIFDFDDTHLRTVIHPSAPVAPVVFALAEWKGGAPKDCLTAFVLGAEMEMRIGNAVYPEHYDVGWHITGTTGVFGAAIAASKLLGQNQQTATRAIGLAATQAAGLREMFGTMAKPFHPGKAAMDGLRSALLSGWGFTSAEQGIEGRRAFGHVLSTKFDAEEVVGDLGARWELLQNSYKPYPCGIVIHPTIDGVLELRQQGVTHEQVASVSARVHPLVQELTGKRRPQTGLEGKFSVFHCAAVGLIDGQVGQAQFSDARVRDPLVIALRDRVELTLDHSMREDECVIEARLSDGRVVEHHVMHARGSLSSPLDDDALDTKFLGLTTPVIGDRKSAEVIAWVRDMEHQASIDGLLNIAIP